MSDKKDIPKFKSNKEEVEFWNENDSTEYIDWSKAEEASFPNLKASTKTISLRLPESLLNDIKVLANKRDVPYQSYLKILLADAVNSEFRD